MDNPKISVLIPLYNRKHYIAQCVDSALNQTFQEDYEIIIRDDCSTDGSFEFVAEKYAKEISAGKIRLYKNEENLGEWGTTNALLNNAEGKYIAVLHSDDMHLPHALKHLYEVAEKTNADVVHESFFLRSPESGIIDSIEDCTPYCRENNTFESVTVMSNNPSDRFNEWLEGNTFIDSQYNLFNREFVLANNIFSDGYDHRYCALWWLMLAKVFVKTPIICYVCRDCPDSGTNANFSAKKIEKFIFNMSKIAQDMDKHFSSIDFFRDNEYAQYTAKAHLILMLDYWEIIRREIYANGITPEIYSALKNSFKKFFGENYFYPMLLFNWLHIMPHDFIFEKKNLNINFAPRRG